MKLLIIALIVLIPQTSLGFDDLKPIVVERKPAVIPEQEVVFDVLSSDQVVAKKSNRILFHIGVGKTSSEATLNNNLTLSSSELQGAVFGGEYLRRDFFKAFNHSFGVSLQGYSNKTGLIGLHKEFKHFDLILSSGVGVIQRKTIASSGNLYEPQLKEQDTYGFIGGLGFQAPIFKRFTGGFQYLTNQTLTLSIGLDF